MRWSSRPLLAFLLVLLLLPWRGGLGDALAGTMNDARPAAHAPATPAPLANANTEAAAAQGHGCCDSLPAKTSEAASKCAACQVCAGMGLALDVSAYTPAAPLGLRPSAGATAYRSVVAARSLRPPIA